MASGVVAGLVLGKPLGVLLFAWLIIKFAKVELQGVTLMQLLGAGCLAGIGFTMALFIAGLALEGHALDPAKVGILFGSAVAAVAGLAILLALGGKGGDSQSDGG